MLSWGLAGMGSPLWGWELGLSPSRPHEGTVKNISVFHPSRGIAEGNQQAKSAVRILNTTVPPCPAVSLSCCRDTAARPAQRVRGPAFLLGLSARHSHIAWLPCDGSRSLRVAGPESDGRKAGFAQSVCVVCLTDVVWSGGPSAPRAGSVLFVWQQWGREKQVVVKTGGTGMARGRTVLETLTPL